MPGKNGQIRFGIGFDVDKNGLKQLEKSLKQISRATTDDVLNLKGNQAAKALADAKKQAAQLQSALEKAYNSKLGTTNISKFNQELKNSNIDLNRVYQSFSKIDGGQRAFRNLATQVLTTNLQLKQTRSLIDTMGTTMMNTIKWGIASSVMNTFTGSIRDAYNYVKVLDSSLTDIRIVTAKSSDQMDKFAVSANKAAQSLGRQTKEYTNAALSFYQQGLSDEQVAARTQATLKASNITGAGTEQMADQLTAVWNGFQIAAQNTEEVVSKMAAVADTSASNMSQLATAMSKVASVANNMGVDVDQLNAQIATIIATTRQAPQTVGNALKTIYARINDIKAGTDEAEISLGNYTGKMAKLGVNVLDANGNLRDTGDVMEQIGQRWSTMTREQQIYLAQTMAGQRQMNNLVALFDNWDMYTKELNVSLSAQGTLNQKNAIALESLAAHARSFEAAQEGLIQSLTDSDSFKTFLDFGTSALNLLTDLVDTIGGGGRALLGLGSLFTSVFSKNISNEIANIVRNMQAMNANAIQLKAQSQINNLFGDVKINDALYQDIVKVRAEIISLGDIVSEEENNAVNELIKTAVQLKNKQQRYRELQKEAKAFYEVETGSNSKNKTDKQLINSLNQITEKYKQLISLVDELNKKGKINILPKNFKNDLDNALTEIKKLQKNTNLSQESRESLGFSINQYYAKVAELRKQGITGNDLFKVESFRDIFQNLMDNASHAFSTIQQQSQQAAQAIKTDVEKIGEQAAEAKEQMDNAPKHFNTEKITRSIVDTASALGQLSYAFTSLIGIGSTWADKTLTNTQKIGRSIIALSTVVPQVIMAYSRLNQTFKITDRLINLLKKHQDLLIISKLKDIAVTKLQVTGTTALKLAIGGLGIAIGAAIAIYSALHAKNQQRREDIIAEKNALIEKNKEEVQQRQNITKNYEAYLQAYNQYKLGKISKDQLAESTESLNGLLDAESIRVAILTGDYEKLTQQVKQASDAQDQITKKLLKDRLSDLDTKAAQTNTQRIIDINTTAEESKAINSALKEVVGNNYTGYGQGFSLGNLNTAEDYFNQYQALSKIIDKLKDTEFKDSEGYLSLINYKTQLEEIALEYQEILTLENEINSKDIFKNSSLNNVESFQSIGDFEKQRQELFNELRNNAPENITDQQIEKLLNSWIQQSGDRLLIDYQSFLDKVNYIKKQIDSFPELISDSLFTETQLDTIFSSYSSAQLDILESQIDYINEQITKRGINSLQTIFDEAILKGTKDFSQEFRRSIQSNLSVYKKFKEEITSGKEIKADDWKSYLDLLQRIKTVYPELRDQVELLKQSWLSSTDEYAVALEKVNDKLSNIAIDQAKGKIEQASESIKSLLFDEEGHLIQIDDSSLVQFENELYRLLQQDHIIDVEITSNLEREVSAVQQQLNNINDAASKIGQNFIIAANDISVINEVFPGILQGMQRLEDGSYQLKDTVVNNAIGAATAEATAEAQSVQERVALQVALLNKKADVYEGMAKAARQLASSETKTDSQSAELREKISKGLSEIQQINSELSSKKQQSDMADIADSSNINAGIMAQNWEEGAVSSDNSIYTFASDAISYAHGIAQAMAGATSIPPQIIDPGIQPPKGAGTSYKGTAGQKSVVTGEITSKDLTEDFFNNTDGALQIAAAQWQAAAAQIRKTANKIQGDIAQLGATAANLGQGLSNISKGQGYAGKKEKGGGKDKTKSAEDIQKMKLKDSDVDRYHQIQRAIKRIDDYLDAMSSYEEKAIRRGKSETIDKEVDALRQQKALYEQKIQLMRQDLQIEQANLAALGVQFDEQGNIINYTALMIAYQGQYNALLEEAKLLTGDAQQAKLKEAEALKYQLDSLKSQMNAYESLQDQIMDAGAAIRDIIDKEEQLKIKQFKINIDVQLEFADAKRDWNEFRKEVIQKIKDDDYLGQAKIRLDDFFSYYDENGNGIIQQLTEHVEKTRREAEIIENGGVSSIYGMNQAQALEDLKHYTDELMQNLKDVQQIAKDIQQLYIDTIDKAQDAFDDQIGQYEQIDGIIQHDLNLLQMLNAAGDNEDELAKYYQLRVDNNNQQLDFLRQQTDMWKKLMEAAQKGSEEWTKFRDNWESSLNDLNSAVEAAVENLLDKYNNTITKIVRETRNQLMGGGRTAWADALNEWDRAKWNDDRYLDSATRATGMLDLIDKFNESMNKQSPKTQREILKLMDSEVSRLNEIPKLRQIDLDIAYKKLEVLQKQMALEDAQQAKTRMRLRRDSQGNYTYQFVADEDDIANRQQELRDTLEELRQLAKVDLTETMDEVEEKLTEFFERATELSQTYFDDEELLQQKLLELQNEYWGEDGYITLLTRDYNLMQSEYLKAFAAQMSVLYQEEKDKLAEFLGLDGGEDDSVYQSILRLIGADKGEIPTLLDIFTTDVIPKNFDTISEENQDLLFGSKTGLNPSWNTALGNMASMFTEMTTGYVIPCMEAIIEANRIYGQDLVTLQEIAGVSFENIASGLDTDIAYTQSLIQNNAALIGTYESEINAIAGVCQAIGNLVGQYAQAEEAAIAAANAAMKFWYAAQGVSVGDYYGTKLGGGTAAAPSAPAVAPAASSSNSNQTGSSSVKSQNNITSQKIGQWIVRDNRTGEIIATTGGTDNDAYKEAVLIANDAAKSRYGDPEGAPIQVMMQELQPDRKNNQGQQTYKPAVKPITEGYRAYGVVMKPTDLKQYKSFYDSFATGGYTGEWVDGTESGGRLALVHQKELVLNETDTSNILNAVGIMRDVLSSVNGINAKEVSLGSMLSGMSTSNNYDESVSQNVVINADFSGVNSADEIKQAFNNLINRASQYANGNRRTY